MQPQQAPDPDESHKRLTDAIYHLVMEHGPTNLISTRAALEEVMIRKALKDSETYNDAADRLGIGKSTMYRKMKEYGIPNRRADRMA